MARKEIGSIFDRNNRNAMNDNFKELYEDVDKYQSKITDKVYSEIVESAKLDWREPVETHSNLPTKSTIGETRMTRDTGKVYRYDGDKWVEIQQIDASPVNEVDSRLSSQLAQKANDSDVRKKSIPITLNDASPEMLAAIQGGEGTTFNIESIPRPSSVDRSKLTNIVNLYNVSELIDDTFYRNDGTTGTSSLIASTPNYVVPVGKKVTLKIPVLTTKVSHYLVFFDSQGNALTDISSNLTTGSLTEETTINFEIPIGAYSFKISLEKANKNNYEIYYEQKVITSDLLDDSVITLMDDVANTVLENVINLYDPTQIINGIFYRLDGTTGSNASLGSTPKLIVPVGKSVTIKIPTLTLTTLSSYVVFWDSNGNVLSNISYQATNGNNTSPVTISFTMPETAHSFTFPVELANKNNYQVYYEKKPITIDLLDQSVIEKMGSSTKWSGKKANFLGDSITEGAELIDGVWTTVNKPYHQHLKDMLGLSVARNYGKASTAISTKSDYTTHTNAFVNRYSTMDNDADLIVVFGGTNDFGHNTPLGTMDDTTDVSFYGALHVLMEGLTNKYLGKRIVFMTPLHRDRTGDNNETNAIGVKLSQYVQAIKEKGSFFGITVIDTYSISGLNPKISIIKTTYMEDGLHPNDLGHELIAKNTVGQFETI